MIKVDKYELAKKLEEELYIRNALLDDEVNKKDVYNALVKSIRDMVAYSWRHSKDKPFSKKQIYIFSFEYNTNNFLRKNLKHLGLKKIASEALQILGYDLDEILKYEVFPLIGEGELGDLSYFMLEGNSKSKVKAYGLRYESGRFKQEIANHNQVEMVDNWTLEDFPWELKRNSQHIKIYGKDIMSTAYDIPIMTGDLENTNTLRLFESNAERLTYPMQIIEGEGLRDIENYLFTNSLSRFLYMEDVNPLGKKIRLGQEYFLACSGVKDIINDLKSFGEIELKEKFKVLLNGSHTIITIPIFIKEYCKNFGVSKEEALKIIGENFQFRTFESIEMNKKIWSRSLIEEVCPDILEYLDYIYRGFEAERDVDYYNFYKILFNTVKDIVPMSKMQSASFSREYSLNTGELPKDYKVEKNLLNVSTWLCQANPKLYKLLNDVLGEDVLKEPSLLKEIPNELKEKQQNKFVKIKDENKLEIKKEVFKDYKIILNPKSMFVMNFGTFQERRRQFLTCLYLTEKYFELIENCNLDMPDMTYFIGGLSSPKYLASKHVIKYINILKDIVNSDLSIKDKLKIVFVEDLNRKKIMNLSKGCDVVEQIATPGLEVVEKKVLNYMVNGSLVMGSKTGINLELKDLNGDFIYLFGSSKDEVESEFKDHWNIEESINKVRLNNLLDKIRNSNFIELKGSFEELYNLILKYNDSFQVFEDYDEYYKKWKKIERDYRNQGDWMKKSLQSIKACGEFSKTFEI